MIVASPVLVTGGTGTLGRLVVARLQETGQSVRVLSRHPHGSVDGVEFVVGDLATGEGVPAAVAGAHTVVHCAGTPKRDAEQARTLVRAASRAGVRHLVNISVVGADRIPVLSRIDRALFGYYAAKWEAEQIVANSGVPWTTLRATQFHDLILTVARALSKLPVVPVFAGVRFQPVDAGEVAQRLVELALDPPAGLVPDLAGPACVRHGRARPFLPPGRRSTATGRARTVPRRCVPGRAGRCHPRPGPGGRPPDLGGLPGRSGRCEPVGFIHGETDLRRDHVAGRLCGR